MAGKFLPNFELYCALNATQANFSKISRASRARQILKQILQNPGLGQERAL
jgi:hypothetical protein